MIKNLVATLTAAAAIIAIVDFLQKRGALSAVDASKNMNAGAPAARPWYQSGTPDNVTAVKCDDCSAVAVGQWEKYGVLPKYNI